MLRFILLLVVFALSGCDQTGAERSEAVMSEAVSIASVATESQTQTSLSGSNPLLKLNVLNYALPESAVDSDELPNVVLQAASGSDPLPYYEIGRDTYLLFGNVAEVDEHNLGFNSNAGFVVTSTGVVLIDALGTAMLGQRLIATVASVTDLPITHLILTRLHPSHSLGRESIEALAGVQVIVPTATRSDPTHAYATLSVGEHTFEIYNLGGVYAGGGLMVHQVDDDILWLSDLASNRVIPDLLGSDLDLRRQALDWVQEHFAEVELMVPGHGSAQSSPFLMLEQNLRYLDALQEGVSGALDAELSLSETVAQVTLPAWSEWHLYEQHQANVSAFYQQLKQAEDLLAQ